MSIAALERTRRLFRLAKGLSGLRRSDIMLVSYPKSGNTWVRFFLCHLIDELEGRSEFTGFERLNRVMPELGVNDLRQPWQHSGLERFVNLNSTDLFGRPAITALR